MKHLLPLAAVCLLLGCAGPAEGPLKGILVVYTPGVEDHVDGFTDDIQLRVETVVAEPVFNFSFARVNEFEGSLRNRRTILFLVETADLLPGELEQVDEGLFRATDPWANGQYVIGVVLGPDIDPAAISALLEETYDEHMWNYVYGSFVATQMSSPERIDSLSVLGFTIDIPKSYALESWRPDDGFVQYQRQASDNCLLMFSVYREEGASFTDDPEEAILRREAMARLFFYDAHADSVDRSTVMAEPLTLNGSHGWKLTGLWRNPEHLNAGAFTSFVLDYGGDGYILDMEVYNPGREKEPYIREGWTIMNSFVPED